ncbi:DUF2891 domain-containing protein [Pseudomonas putida]|nr:DUF2891 domain-containing protein [Pseudomonas putida]
MKSLIEENAMLDTVAFKGLVTATLRHVRQEFPHSQSRVFESAEDFEPPSAVHPIFYGSYDWHSCVHGYWLLARALEHPLDPELTRRIVQLFDEQFTADNVAKECQFFSRPAQQGFERPYGWAWLLKLTAQLSRCTHPHAAHWCERVSSLARIIAARLRVYLPKLSYPIESGIHNNTAFSLLLALDYADSAGDIELQQLLRAKGLQFFGDHSRLPANEPGGEDFLSPTWQRALLMQQLLSASAYGNWLLSQLSLIDEADLKLLTPVATTDRSDGRLAHLDGLNLSRAWCMKSISRSLDPKSSLHARLLEASDLHLKASENSLHDHYMGEHWLGTFLFLALDL